MQDERSSWAVGWSAFAGFVLITVGFFQIVAGIVALVDDTFWVVGKEYVFQFDITTWGWIHLILGIILVLSGFGIFAGNVAARTVGVIFAIVSAITAFMWLPWYPVWSIVIIALDVAVIWALTAHGRDIAEE
ncbi:MAG: hypothetical protein IT198_14535 [Acidimicrobiia bacterium]|nr:hypothetical protein [Acidimicrobiia bacterium]